MHRRRPGVMRAVIFYKRRLRRDFHIILVLGKSVGDTSYNLNFNITGHALTCQQYFEARL